MLRKSFIIYCLFIFTYPLISQEINKYKNINWRIYHSANWRDYVDYQSEEWKNIPYKEKIALLQIPDKELHAMSTRELIEVTSNSFFARDFYLFSSIKGYNHWMFNLFNGFRELTRRKDVCSKIIEYYKNIRIESTDNNAAGLSVREHVQILEYFIANPKIFSKFNSAEKNQLFSVLKEKYAKKSAMTSIYNEYDMVPNIYALAKVLDSKDRQTSTKLHSINDIELFLDSGKMLTRGTRDQIIKLSKEN